MKKLIPKPGGRHIDDHCTSFDASPSGLIEECRKIPTADAVGYHLPPSGLKNPRRPSFANAGLSPWVYGTERAN
jgi:hypothetical protein